MDCIQAIINCSTQVKQVKYEEINISSLLYTFLKEEVKDSSNIVLVTKNAYTPYVATDINMCMLQGLQFIVIPYQGNQPVDPLLQDSNLCLVSLFDIYNYLEDDIKNVICSLFRITAFIKQCTLENRTAQDILQIVSFGYMTWKFISAIYESSWDKLMANMTFRQYIFTQFNKTPSNKTLFNLDKGKGKQTDISRVPPPIFLKLSKSILAKSKFFFKKNILVNSNSQDNKQLYTQVSKNNPKLSLDNVSEIYNIISKSSQKGKQKINMTTKHLSRKQIVIYMGSNNVERVIVQSNTHIANINRQFKNIKSKISVNFMHSDNKGIVINTNKIAFSSDLNIM